MLESATSNCWEAMSYNTTRDWVNTKAGEKILTHSVFSSALQLAVKNPQLMHGQGHIPRELTLELLTEHAYLNISYSF